MNIPKMDLSINSLPHICRTCLVHEDLYPIKSVDWDNTPLNEILHKYVFIQVEEKSDMPKNICKTCITKLYSTYRFLENCSKSTLILNNVLSKKSEISVSEQQISGTEVSLDNKVNSENSDDCGANIELEENYTDKVPEHINKNIKNIVESESLADKIRSIKKEILENSELEKRSNKAKRSYVKTIDGPPFVCVVCSETFENYPSLKAHRTELRHYKAKKYICPHCGRPHDANSKLQEHIRTHTGEKPNECYICSRRFNFKVDLKRHMVMHSDKKPYNCKFCSKGFSRKQYLTDHERKHTGEKLICTYCGKLFLSISTLYYHEKTHQNPNNDIVIGKDNYYHCNLCDKVLLTELTLKTHLLLHGPRNFSCEKCGKTFVNKNRLQDHIRFTHNEHKYPCTLCDKVYKSKGGLELHVKSHTGENSYNCEFCSKHFTCRGSLQQHMRLHTGDTRFQCVECQHVCINKRHLENHMRVHTGERPFSCEYCGKAFAQKVNLTAHLRIHTGEKRHMCAKCGKGFYDSRGLRKHSAVHSKETNIL